MTTTTPAPYRATERVAAGTAWLDEHRPGWHREIDLYALDMMDCNACVLGQLYGTYVNAPLPEKTTPLSGKTVSGFSVLAASMGFTALTGSSNPLAEFAVLAQQWRQVIAGRQTGGVT